LKKYDVRCTTGAANVKTPEARPETRHSKTYKE